MWNIGLFLSCHVVVFDWRLRPTTIYDEIGAVARNFDCYIVMGFWKWGGSGADSAY